MNLPIAGIMGPGEQATAKDQRLAYELGQRLAHHGWAVLTGGRQCGVMDAASRGAKQAGGLTIGVLPTRDRTNVSPAIDVVILTGMGDARNAINVLSSHVIIACGIGAGTASEIALGIKANKPVILLHPEPDHYRFFHHLAPTLVSAVATPAEVIPLAQVWFPL